MDQALARLGPAVVVAPAGPHSGGLRAYHDITESVTRRDGRPADTAHAVLQLSSGSTGP